MRVYCNVNISKMAFKYLKKEVSWFYNTKLNRYTKKEKNEPEEKILALNAREKKQNNNDERILAYQLK